MFRIPSVLVIGLLCCIWSCTNVDNAPKTNTVAVKESPEKGHLPQIILKLDDLWYEDGLVHKGWLQAIEFIDKLEIPGTIGLIGDSLEDAPPEYFDWIKRQNAKGHEVWHHGFCHCKPEANGAEQREFRGMSCDFQETNLQRAQQLAEEKLGIILRSFGAPYNATDACTATVIDELPDLKIWMYKETDAPTNKFLLPRIEGVGIEFPVHQPDFEQFKAGYLANKQEPVLLLQGHPRSWVTDASRFEEFKKIVTYLKEEGVRFTTPYAYYQAVR